GFRAVADILLVAVDEQVGSGAVDQLEAALGGRFPMVGGDALADDASRHRDELVVDVSDAQFLDFLPHLLNKLGAARLLDMGFQIGHRGPPLPILHSRACRAACFPASSSMRLRSIELLASPLIYSDVTSPQLHGNGECEVGCSLPSAKRLKRNGRSRSLSLPQMSSATSLPTPIIL